MGQLPDRYKYEYKMSPCGESLDHTWSVVGDRGGIHLNLRLDSSSTSRGGVPSYIGGIEVHYRTPPEYMKDDPPSHDHCWLLDAPCWHEGFSLQVVEIWGPRVHRNPQDHMGMFRSLAESADDRFGYTQAAHAAESEAANG